MVHVVKGRQLCAYMILYMHMHVVSRASPSYTYEGLSHLF